MLALIAGTGDLPPALIARLPARPLVCALAGFRPSVTPDITFRIETLGSFLAELKARSVTEVCMAGAIRRPKVDPAAIDAATAPLVPRIAAAIAAGDDGALRTVIAIFEEAGFTIKAAHEIAPDLLPPAGIPTRAQPTARAREDAVLGDRTVAEMGAADTGQACLIRAGRVIAREGPEGTDAMIRRFAPSDDPLWGAVDAVGDLLGTAAEWLGGDDATPMDAKGAILFKAPKPGQDRRADLPVIGPETVAAAAAAQLSGIVIAADGVMILDRDRVIAAADKAGLFLWIRREGGA